MCCCSSISCSHDGSNSKCGWPYVIDTTPDLQRKWDTFLDGRAAAAPKLSGLQPSSGQLSSHTLSYLAPSRQQQQQQFQNPAQLQQHCPFNPPPTHHADNDAILQLLGGGSLCSSPAFTPPAATPSQPPVTNTTWLMQHTPRADHAATASKPAATLHAAANTATPHCMAGCSKDTVARPGMHVSAHSSRLASHGGCGRPGMRVADLSTLSPKALLQSPAPETVQPAAAGGPWDEASQPWLPPRRQQYHQQQQRHQQHERLQIQEHFELPQQQQQQQQKHQQQPSGPWQGQQQQLLHPPAATASSRALQSSHQSTVEAPANEPRTSLQHGPEAQQQQQVLAQQRTLHPQHQQVQQQQQFQQHKKQQQQHFQQRNQQQQQQRCQQQLHSLGNCMSRPGQPGAIAGGAMQGSTSHASLGQAKPALSVLTSTMSYSSQQAAPHQVAGPRGTAEGMLEQQQQQQQQQQQHTRTGQPRWGAVSAAQQHQQLLQLPQGAPAWGDHRADQQPQQQQQQPQQQQQHSAGGGNSWPSITTPWTPQSTTAAAPMQHYPQQQQQQQHSRLLNTSSSSAACPWTEAVDGDLTPNATEPRAIPAGCLPGPAPTSRWAASSTSMQQQLPPVYIPNCAPSSNAAAAAVAAAVQASGKRPAGEAAAAAAASTAQPQVAAKRQKRSTGPAAAASSGGGGGRGATGGRAGAKYGSNVTITCTRPGEAVDPADAAAIAAAIAARGAKQTTLEQSLQRAAAAGGLDAAAAEEEVDPAEDEAGAEEPPRRLTAEERMRRQRVRIRLLKKGGKQLLARVAAAEQARKGKQGSAAAAAGSGGRSAASKGRRQVQLPQGLREGVSEGIVGGSEEPSAAGSRGNNGRRGGSRSSLQRTKAAAEAAAAACREQLQLEQLPQDGSVQLLDGPAAWLAARSALSGAQGCCFGLLHAAECGSAAQYYTSLVGLSKEQQAALRKAAAEQRRAKGKAPAITTSTSSGSPEASSSSSYLAGVAVVPLLPSSHSCSTPAMYIYLLPPAAPGAAAPCLGAAAQQLLEQVLANPQLPCLCCDAKAVLVALQQAGWVVPPADMLQLVDPCVLGWVLESQRVQDAKDSDCYSLLQQLERNGMGPSQDCYQLPPLLRLQWQLQQAAHLAVHQQQLLQHMQAPQALKVELKVLGVLARMEALGVCCDPAPLRRHHAHLRTRMAALTARAEQLVGHPINLSSASQLATVLYQELALPAPTVTAGRHAAKTHHSTDEAALQQLSQQHELPGLVLEHRCLLNITSKWLESPWVAALCATADAAASEQQGRAPAAGSTTSGGSAAVPAGCVITAGAAATAAAAGVCGSGAVRGPAGALVGVVRCCWSQVSTATGRLSCSGPNLQAVTKYTVRAHTIPQHAPVQQPQKQQPGGPSSAALEEINIRDAFVAPAGRLLLSADYSQIELRLLAHFSGDSGLLQLLRQAGPAGDVFTAVAARCLKDPITGQMPADARERAKRVTYAIIYGSTPFGLAQQLQQQGVTQAAAQQLISSFLAAFPGVKRFMDSSIAAAAQAGWVTTLLGRRREIGGLCSGDAKERAAAARKVVNTIIQGSAADLIKLAMCAWDDWIHSSSSSSSSSSSGGGGGGSRPPASYTRHTAPTTTSTSSPPVAPAALIAQIHDELLFEVSAGSVADPQFTRVASAVERLMSGAVQLEVPLIVNLTAGQRWGSMVRWQQQQ